MKGTKEEQQCVCACPVGLSLRDSSGENSVQRQQQQQLKVLCNSFLFFYFNRSSSLSHSFMLAGTAVAAFRIIQNEPEGKKEGKASERARDLA